MPLKERHIYFMARDTMCRPDEAEAANPDSAVVECTADQSAGTLEGYDDGRGNRCTVEAQHG